MPLEIKTDIEHPDVQPVKRDYDNIDSLLSEMGVPKQKIGPEPAADKTDAQPEQSATWQPPYEQPIDHEEALRSGKRLAKTIDAGFAFLAGMYAKSDDTGKYKATPGEIDDLAEPLSEISEKYNFRISPELRLVFLLVTIYGPKAILAVHDRKINELEDRVSKLEEQAREKEAEIKAKESKAEKGNNTEPVDE